MMDRLWAPWRLDYVTGDRPKDPESVLTFLPGADSSCFLCQGAVAPRSDFKARYLLRVNEWTLALLNRFPYNNGHLLIAPKRHVSRLELLTPEESKEISDEITYWVGRLQETMNPDGMNIGLNLGHAAGAGLPGHLHWHIVPRWNGDTNYITTIGSTKVIPQSLEALWEILTQR